VDFAYLIHTEIGHKCVGAKVNGQMVSLPYVLQTGDIVEVVTSKNHTPSKDWLKFVKTIKARAKIRQWVKTQEKERSISLGREMLDKAFRKERLNFVTESKTEKMGEVVASLGVKTIDDLIASVGYGKVTPLQVLRPFTAKPVSPDSRESLLEKLMSRVRKKKPRAGVLVKGLEDILIKFGKCCQPVPGDRIIGYITQGFGVTVHRASCVNALRSSPERQIEVEWNTASAESYPAKIQIISYDRMGLLADLVGSISKLGANILNASSDTKENKTVESLFTIGVADTGHLERILTAIRTVKQVQDARRIG
jgi:GTP pyrophosphokinase